MSAESREFPSEVLSSAISAFLGWKVDRRPASHPEKVLELAPDGRGHELLSAVMEAIRRSDEIRLSDEVWAGTSYGLQLKAELRAQQPELSAEAVDALASRLAFLQFN